MKTNSTKTAKTAKQVSNVAKINLSALTEKLKNVDETKNVSHQRTKSLLYIYPESLQGLPSNDSKMRAFRTKRRDNMQKFKNNIEIFAKRFDMQKTEDAQNELISEIEKFKSEYKNFYQKNDFAPSSVTDKADKEKHFVLMFEIIKSI